MGNLLCSPKKSNAKKEEEEVSSVAYDQRETSSPHIRLDICSESGSIRRRILHRVPPEVREDKKHIFDPVVLSLGPYHHGKTSRFRQVEELKGEVVDIICGAKDKGLLLGHIQERVDEIKHFYKGGEWGGDYGDEALAEIMLRDACFVIYYMKMMTAKLHRHKYDMYKHIVHHLGMSGFLFVARDFYMLENQIPLWLIQLLISLTSDDNQNEGEGLLYKFLSGARHGDCRLTRVPWEKKEEEPLHLLEAHHRTSIFKEEKASNSLHWIFKCRRSRRKRSESSPFEMANCQFRSVTDLKAKGIHFSPSSYCLKDIRFSSYWFYGKLQLPIWFVNNNSKVFFSNAVAFEMSPATETDFAVTSYVNFMKSLIQNLRDVKELREKGILFSMLANDEQVVSVFKEIDTYGFRNGDLFQDVKMNIEEHCSSKTKTWMAELGYTYFHTPWKAIALLAATLLLCLTFLQTYYTINPR